MKRLLLLILSIITFISCKDDKDSKGKKDYIVLSGKVKNYRRSKIKLIGYNYEHIIKFDKQNKTFNDTIRGLKPGFYVLDKVRKGAPVKIYLDGEKDLNIILDAKKRNKKPLFKGAKSLVKINKYLLLKRKKFHAIIKDLQGLFAMEEPEFIKISNRYTKTLKKILKKYNLPKSFSEMEEKNIDAILLRYYNNYQSYYRLLTGDDEFVASENIFKKLENVDLNDDEKYNFSVDYRMFLKEYFERLSILKTEDDGEIEDDEIDYKLVDIIVESVKSDYIKSTLLYEITSDKLVMFSDPKPFYDKVIDHISIEDYKNEIIATYDKLKVIAKGMPSPKFEELENYKGGKTSLDDLIGNGKFTYIDVWATWCSICQREVPLLKNFEEKYHGKNIQFVSINVDAVQNKPVWRKMIEESEVGGVQLFAGKETKDFEFAKKYLIKGLPRFILIDPEGKIVTHSGLRPSKGYLLDDFFEENGVK